MSNIIRRYENIFTGLSAVATLTVLLEIVLQSFGRSICPAEGCKIVSAHARYGELSILLIGLLTFLTLTMLSLYGRKGAMRHRDALINAVLIVSLASEGYFTGYQAFFVHTPCLFCLGILSVIVLLGLIRVVMGELIVLLSGFCAFGAVFGMLYLVPPPAANISLPADSRLLLFYSKDCKHCSEVIKELDDKKIAVAHLPVGEYAAYLKGMGIEAVPTLMVNDPYQKVFLTGRDAIDRYLQSCEDRSRVPVAPANMKSMRKKPQPSAAKSAPAPDLFNPTSLFSAPAPSADDGMCREDEICK